jgi:predicted PurR-regulated permease PerM
MDNRVKLPFYAKASLLIIGVFAFVTMLSEARNIILPVIFAGLIAVVLHPLKSFFLRHGLNRLLSIIVTLLIAILLVTGLGLFIILQIARFTETWPELVAKFNGYINEAVMWVSQFLDIDIQKVDDWLENTKSAIYSKTAPVIGQTLLTIGNILVVLLLIPVYVFMILYYEPIILEFIRRSFETGYHHKVTQVVTEVKNLIQGYISGLFIEMVIVAGLNVAALLLLGIEYAVLLGIIGAILNLIPYIGGIVAVALPMMIALVTKDSPLMPVYVLILYYIIQLIDNNFLVPKIVASKVRLNALVSIIVVLAFGALWGIAGMFVSIPVTAIIKLISDHIDPLKPFGFLLGDSMPDRDFQKNTHPGRRSEKQSDKIREVKRIKSE